MQLSEMNRSLRVKDNIDVNQKANFNKSSYHGTSSSIIQFRAINDVYYSVSTNQWCLLFSFEQPIRWRSRICSSPIYRQYLSRLKKKWYLCLLNILQSKIYTLHNLKINFGHLLLLLMCHQQLSSYDTAVTEEPQWLIIYAESLSSELFNRNVYRPGRAPHHASQKRGIQTPPGNNAILPLLQGYHF